MMKRTMTGKKLGDILKKVEAWWLREKGRPDKEACLRYAETLIANEPQEEETSK